MGQRRGEGATRQVHQLLEGKLKAAPRGAVTKACLHLGRSESFLRKKRRSDQPARLDLGDFVDLCDFLEEDPAVVLGEAVGSEPERGLGPPAGEPPAIVPKAWERFRSCPESRRRRIDREVLEQLDTLRYEQAERVVRQTEELVDHVDLEILPRLLGVAGSAYRLWDIQLDAAQHVIEAGLQMAKLRGDQGATGDLMQRLSYVAGDHGLHEAALEVAERATGVLVRAGDLVGVGKSLVDQGMWLYYLDRPLEAIKAQETALRRLPESVAFNRLTALQGLALNYHSLGKDDQAFELAQEAKDLCRDFDPSKLGKVLWLEARISMGLKDYALAEKSLLKAVQIYLPIHHGETVLATTDLVRVRLLQERPFDAWETAKTLHKLMWPLRTNRIISAAIADLLRVTSGGLTLALVERVRAKIERERERPSWRSLRAKAR